MSHICMCSGINQLSVQNNNNNSSSNIKVTLKGTAHTVLYNTCTHNRKINVIRKHVCTPACLGQCVVSIVFFLSNFHKTQSVADQTKSLDPFHRSTVAGSIHFLSLCSPCGENNNCASVTETQAGTGGWVCPQWAWLDRWAVTQTLPLAPPPGGRRAAVYHTW